MIEPGVVGDPSRILLGGGIGAGKSAAGRRLALHGFTVVEADILGHELLEHGGAASAEVKDRWPEALVDGLLDRRVLAGIVFSDAEQLAELEAMTHVHIVRRIEEIAADAERLVVEIPVLLDPAGEWVKVYVAAPRQVRRDRAVLRGGSLFDVDQRMSRQAEHEAWMAWADYVIVNDGSLDDLDRLVDEFWHRLPGSRRGVDRS